MKEDTRRSRFESRTFSGYMSRVRYVPRESTTFGVRRSRGSREKSKVEVEASPPPR